MIPEIAVRLGQGSRTLDYPRTVPSLPDRFRGRPVLHAERCAEDCSACIEACPTQAIRRETPRISVDLGRCLFCAECADVCPNGALSHTREHRLATRKRSDLVLRQEELRLASALEGEAGKLFSRSLRLRQVSAGGCGACEADLNVLSTVVWDLGRFGIGFVASPRHADGLVVTGPVSRNMKAALLKTYEALPSPKIVIAVGACAISGGVFRGNREVSEGVESLLPVDLFIPGCPPHPLTLLDGLLRLQGRLSER